MVCFKLVNVLILPFYGFEKLEFPTWSGLAWRVIIILWLLIFLGQALKTCSTTATGSLHWKQYSCWLIRW